MTALALDRIAAAPAGGLREDLRLIGAMVEPGTRVLDIGCGDGALLAHLAAEKGVDARGVELSQSGVNACVARGLSVVQGNADQDLEDYPDGAFDVVILSQTLQATRKPRRVLHHLVRIGRRSIVSFPNFGHWRVRLSLLLRGRMPVSPSIPYAWHDTPNIHHCTVTDFAVLCAEMGIAIERGIGLDGRGRPWRLAAPGGAANILAAQAIFALRRADRNAPPPVL